MKFSIRDLLLVTVIVALAVGWGVDHWQKAIKVEPFIKAQKAAEAHFAALRDIVERDGSEVWWEQNAEGGELKMVVMNPPPKGLPNSSALAPNPPRP